MKSADKRWLAVIVGGYLVLALLYNIATPVTKPPDEGPHVEYVRYLVERHRFPVFGSEPGLTYEAHQPPLYYVLSAPVWAAVRAVSGPASDAPARAVRVLTTLIGGVGLLLMWALARVLYRNDRWLPLAVTAFAAFLPMRLALAAAVSNDVLQEALFTASLLLMALMIRDGYTHRRAVGLGLAMGAALLTKTTGVLLLPVALVAIMLASRVREPVGQVAIKQSRGRAPGPAPPPAGLDARAFFGGCVLVFGIAAALGAPWLLRNRLLYGDFLAQRIFEESFQNTPRREDFLALRKTVGQYWIQFVLPYTYSSFWGVFGHMTIWMPRSVYIALILPTAVALVGAILHLRRAREVLDETQRATWLVLWLCLFLVLSGFLRFLTVFFQAQGRYLSPAMAPIALLMVVGWFVFVPPRARPAATVGIGAVMAALSLYAVVGVILPYFRLSILLPAGLLY